MPSRIPSTCALSPARDKITLEHRLKGLLARQIWRTEGYYEVTNNYDPAFIKALEVVSKINEVEPDWTKVQTLEVWRRSLNFVIGGGATKEKPGYYISQRPGYADTGFIIVCFLVEQLFLLDPVRGNQPQPAANRNQGKIRY